MNIHDGIRTETRTRFIEGEGHLVEEVEIGKPVGKGESTLPAAPREPAAPVVVSFTDVPLSLARQVCEANGLLVVPASFLNGDQLAELRLDPDNINTIGDVINDGKENDSAPAKKLTEAQAIKAAKSAVDFDELNALVAEYPGTKVLAAAESRAAELKG